MLGIVLFTFLVGSGFMLLWNGIMPAVFGLGIISFWQSLGLILIGRLIFGGFGKRRSRWNQRNRYHMWHQRCQRMKEQRITVE